MVQFPQSEDRNDSWVKKNIGYVYCASLKRNPSTPTLLSTVAIDTCCKVTLLFEDHQVNMKGIIAFTWIHLVSLCHGKNILKTSMYSPLQHPFHTLI